MSRTQELYCPQCKEHIWVAQASSKSNNFYDGDPKIMKALGEFLFRHVDHQLIFTDSENVPFDSKEVKIEDEEDMQEPN